MFAIDDFFNTRRRPAQYFTGYPFYQPQYYNGRCGPFFRDYEEEVLEQRRLQQQRAREEAERRKRLEEEYIRRMHRYEEAEDEHEEENEEVEDDEEAESEPLETRRQQLIREHLKRKKQAEEEQVRRRAEMEKKRQPEQESVRQIREQKRLMQEEEKKKLAIEQARVRAIEERKRIEEERKRKDELYKKMMDERQRKIEEERKKREETARKRFESAATMIQKHVRGFLIRKTQPLEPLRKIKQVEARVEESRKRWERLLLAKMEVLSVRGLESTTKEKAKKEFKTTVLAFEEDMVKQLLSLDAIQTGGLHCVRERRRSAALCIQAILDDVDKVKKAMNTTSSASSTGESKPSTLYMQTLVSMVPLALNDMEL